MASKKSYELRSSSSFIGLMIDVAKEVPKHWNTFCSIEIDMSHINNLRSEYRHKGLKLTYTAFVLKAIAMGVKDQMREVSQLNAQVTCLPWRRVVYFKDINMSVATEVQVGNEKIFYAPIIESIDRYSVEEIAEELIKSSRASTKDHDSLVRDLSIMRLPAIIRRIVLWFGANIPSLRIKYRGNLMVTGVGQYGVDLIPPGAVNLQFSIGSIKPRAVVMSDGKIQSRLTMSLTAVFDHRLLYAAPVARLLVLIRDYLENFPSEWVENGISKQELESDYLSL